MAFGEVQSPPGAPVAVERRIPGPTPGSTVRVLIIDPVPGSRNRPALLHLHGGGYVVGAPENSTPGNQRYAMECGCVVVSVDYRLAPETAFPGALEDNYAVLRWLHANAAALGVDPARIGVGGESAGGGHAAALAIAARDRAQFPVAFQFLVYPMLDDRTGSSRKVSPYVGEYIWTAVSNQFGWSSLLGVPAGSQIVPDGAVPARVRDLAGLPPAFIGVGALDLFIEEDLEYARRLITAGVPVEVHVAPGTYHGFDKLAPATAPARHFTATLVAALGRLIAASAVG
jgi:acetyl esterase/lipase